MSKKPYYGYGGGGEFKPTDAEATSEQLNECRADFEKYMLEECDLPPNFLKRNDDDAYHYLVIAADWHLWQAAWNRPSKQANHGIASHCFDYHPTLPGFEVLRGSEPSLRRIIHDFYKSHGIDTEKATVYTNQYIAAIEKELNG